MTYGYCPICGLAGITRERRPNGNDRCISGHVYPSAKALKVQPTVDMTQNELRLDLLARLQQLDCPEACLNGTPMIPLHRNTVKEIILALQVLR